MILLYTLKPTHTTKPVTNLTHIHLKIEAHVTLAALYFTVHTLTVNLPKKVLGNIR